jgi:hypothetical protein
MASHVAAATLTKQRDLHHSPGRDQRSSHFDATMLREQARELRAHARSLEARAAAFDGLRARPTRWADLLNEGQGAFDRAAAGITDETQAANRFALVSVAAALRGDNDQAFSSASRAEASSNRDPSVDVGIALARAMAWMSAGQPATAFEAVHRLLAGDRLLCTEEFVLVGIFAETAVATHQQGRALEVITEIRRSIVHASGEQSDLELKLADAILNFDDTERNAERSLFETESCSALFLARMNLGLGMWLRRHRQPAESRVRLEQARAQFFGLCRRRSNLRPI